MANYNGPDDKNREREDIEAQDDPEFKARLRQDIQAAIATPEAGEFSSRRAAIMAQIRAEANSSNAAPVDFATHQQKRQKRQSLPVWIGAIAASLVIVFVSIIIVNILSSNSAIQPTANEVAGGATSSDAASKLAPAPTSASSSAPGAAGSSNPSIQFSAATTAAATTAAAPPMAASAPIPTGAASNSGAGNAAKTTTAAATTAAATTVAAATTAAARATTVAATTAAATTAAARIMSTATPAALPTPSAEAATGIATGSILQAAQLGPFQLYPQASPVSVVTETAGVIDFLRGQTAIFLPNPAERERVGLSEKVIPTYSFQLTRLNAEKTDTIVLFYNTQAANNGYKAEGDVQLQNDNNLQVRWLYFSKDKSKLGLLIIEVANSTSMNITDFAGIKRGETGIFLVMP